MLHYDRYTPVPIFSESVNVYSSEQCFILFSILFSLAIKTLFYLISVLELKLYMNKDSKPFCGSRKQNLALKNKTWNDERKHWHLKSCIGQTLDWNVKNKSDCSDCNFSF